MRISQMALCVMAGMCAMATVATAQDPVQELRRDLERMQAEYEQRLQTELERMQAEYERRVQKLERRLRQLEQAPAEPAAATAPEPVAAEAAEPAPPSVTERLATLEGTLERATLDFGFDGYFRSGIGGDGKGNTQSTFQAPNSGAKYRLGNEAETYMEAAFTTRTPPDQVASDEVTFDTGIRLAYFTPLSDSNDFDTTTSLREAFAKVKGLVPSDPGMVFWAGERFYSRYDVHMNDFFYRDMSGYGGGVEDVTIGDDFAKLSLAWIGGSIDELDANGVAFAEEGGRFSKDSLDLGLYDIAVAGGSLALFGTYSRFDGDAFTDEEGRVIVLEDSDGFAAGLIHDSDPAEHLHNRFVAQYGEGAAYNFRSQLFLPGGLDRSDLTRVDVNELRTWRVLNQLDMNGDGRWSMLSLLLFEDNDYGTERLDRVRWVSAGVRPAYHLNDHVSFALEAGYDHTDQDDGLSGSVVKLTLAPQIAPEPLAYARPSIRGYFTYAWWDDELEGAVGGPSFSDDTEGLAAGVQVEAWW